MQNVSEERQKLKEQIMREQGERLARARSGVALPQEVLSERLGVSLKQYQRYESGESAVPPDVMWILSSQEYIDLNYVMGDVKSSGDLFAISVKLTFLEKGAFIKRIHEYWGKLTMNSYEALLDKCLIEK